MNGQIVLLNGVPASGKSTTAAAVQASFPGVWMNMDKDFFKAMTPEPFQPGICMRPGGERPDLEEFIVRAYTAWFDSMAAHSRARLNVVAAAGLHDNFSKPLGIHAMCAARLQSLPVLLVGVRCSTDHVLERRIERGWTSVPDEVIERFERSMHIPGVYDVEVDTSRMSVDECARAIGVRLAAGPGTAIDAYVSTSSD